MKRFFVALVLLAALVSAVRAPIGADPPAYAWVQFAQNGSPQIRAIARGGRCPDLHVDGAVHSMRAQVSPDSLFPNALCVAAFPVRASVVDVEGVKLPTLAHHVDRIAVLGDTGCRIKEPAVQNCNDHAAWPFATVAASIAREKPDLIVHVGDYQYRESCLPLDPRCSSSPTGDRWPAWEADVFAPATPLFSAAPIIWARGNHEDCKRAGIGWSRYLAPDPSARCRDHEKISAVTLAGIRIINVDSANGNENNPDPTAFEADERLADELAAGETWLLTHRPPLEYLAKHRADEENGPHLDAILAGHVHLFAALSFADAPPTIIVGNGGDTLSTLQAPQIAQEFQATSEARFGFAIFTRADGGWTISERDPDGTEHRTCTLAHRAVRC